MKTEEEKEEEKTHPQSSDSSQSLPASTLCEQSCHYLETHYGYDPLLTHSVWAFGPEEGFEFSFVKKKLLLL
jgi:hypothetical protein